MAYHEHTTDRFRQAVGKRPELSEKRMMGGFFFVDEESCDDAALNDWMHLALSFVEKLPIK